MDLLVITNLYPPQELGGYGRCIADFVWGLKQRGHRVQVLCSDAPHLGPSQDGPSGEPVERTLELKGAFRNGISHELNWPKRRAIDARNIERLNSWLQRHRWDGVLLGNLDLLGAELLPTVMHANCPVLHHIGFVLEPYKAQDAPPMQRYRMVAASQAVLKAQRKHGFQLDAEALVYPGCRDDLLGAAATQHRPLPTPPDGSANNPLRIGFAGLIIQSKGPHTLVKAVRLLRDHQIPVSLMLAGAPFAKHYHHSLQVYIQRHGLEQQIQFVGELKREQLARFFRLQHVCVFPSIFPEAFGIVAAEAMASGLALVSSGAGGAAEVFEDEVSGLSFPPGDAHALADQLARLAKDPALLQRLQEAGEARIRTQFSVKAMALKLESLFASTPKQG